jgi:hypothetical protein
MTIVQLDDAVAKINCCKKKGAGGLIFTACMSSQLYNSCTAVY